jgi:hypothetical protein
VDCSLAVNVVPIVAVEGGAVNTVLKRRRHIVAFASMNLGGVYGDGGPKEAVFALRRSLASGLDDRLHTRVLTAVHGSAACSTPSAA